MVIAAPEPNIEPAAIGEQRVAISGLSWEGYLQILNALPQSRGSRLTYDTRIPHPELVSISLGISPAGTKNAHWLQLKFALTTNASNKLDLPDRDDKNSVGELILILDENLEVVDENWLIDVNSLCVIATR